MGNLKKKLTSGLIALSMLASSAVPAFAGGLNINNKPANSSSDVILSQEITKDNGDGTFEVKGSILPNSVLENKDLSLEILFDIDRSGSMSHIISGIGEAMDEFIDYAITNNPNKNVKIGFVGYGGEFYTGDDYGTFKPTDDVEDIKTALYQSGQDSKFRNVQIAMDYFTNESKATNKVFVEISDGMIIPSNVTIPNDVESFGIATNKDMNEENGLGHTLRDRDPNGVVLMTPQEAFEYITTSNDHIYHAPEKELADKALKEILEKAVGKTPEDITATAEFKITEGFELVGDPSVSTGDVSVNGDTITWSNINLSESGSKDIDYTLKAKDDAFDEKDINESAKLEVSNGNSEDFPIPSVSLEKEKEPTPEPPAPEEPEVETNPEIKLTKTVNKKEVNKESDILEYKVTVENTGDTELEIIEFNDSLVDSIKLKNNKIKPNDIEEVSYSYKVTEDDLDSSVIINQASVKAIDNEGKEVSSSDKVETKVIKEEEMVPPAPEPLLNPAIKVTKHADKESINKNDRVVNYVISITNTGDTDLEILSVKDSLVDVDDYDKTLLKGDVKEIKYSYEATDEDLKGDSLINEVAVKAVDEKGNEVSDTDNVSVNIEKEQIVPEKKEEPKPVKKEEPKPIVVKEEKVKPENPYKKVQTSDESGSSTIFSGIGILTLSGVLYLVSSKRKQLN